MRRTIALSALATALCAASVAFAARGGTAQARPVSLHAAVLRAASADSLRFDLTVQVDADDAIPQTLHVRGASAGGVQRVHMKVDDVVAPDGTTLTGPSAEERVDGTFLYLRSTVTRPLVGPLWVRERLSRLDRRSAELSTLRSVSASRLLTAFARARGVRAGAEAGVFHAWLPYADPTVRTALRGVEGDREYRHLRLTGWVGGDGRVSLLLLRGRTADRSSSFVLSLALGGYGKPVAVRAPGQGRFVDFDLAQLRA
ncbi:MAG TPA: hypothetical protein VFJ77_03705 [Gaiellaceae bacterium]|nr:hypothetical protein [Gaiellaceae bacterium]